MQRTASSLYCQEWNMDAPVIRWSLTALVHTLSSADGTSPLWHAVPSCLQLNVRLSHSKQDITYHLTFQQGSTNTPWRNERQRSTCVCTCICTLAHRAQTGSQLDWYPHEPTHNHFTFWGNSLMLLHQEERYLYGEEGKHKNQHQMPQRKFARRLEHALNTTKCY